MAEYSIESVEQARDVIERFNGFHDGFIERLSLRSHDYFPERGVHTTTGLLDLEITFAHYNYDAGAPPPDRRIDASFTKVRDLTVRFTGAPTDWPIIGLYLEPTDRGTKSPGRLLARLVQPRLIDNTAWEHVEAMRFTFERARFWERQETP